MEVNKIRKIKGVHFAYSLEYIIGGVYIGASWGVCRCMLRMLGALNNT